MAEFTNFGFFDFTWPGVAIKHSPYLIFLFIYTLYNINLLKNILKPLDKQDFVWYYNYKDSKGGEKMSKKTRRKRRRLAKRQKRNLPVVYSECLMPSYEIVYRYRGSKKKYIERMSCSNIKKSLEKISEIFEVVSIWPMEENRIKFLKSAGIKIDVY